MRVPSHLCGTGAETHNSPEEDLPQKKWMEKERIVQQMCVPERLVVAGGEGHVGRTSQPKEVLLDQFPSMPINGVLKELPEQLTLSEENFPDVPVPPVSPPPSAREEQMSQSSIAIEENPLKELKLMRRELSRMTTRMYTLEDETEKVRVRDRMHWAVTIIGFTFLSLLHFIRK